MNGIHDMGGMHGFGPIEYEENEPVFHHEWEGRIYAMFWNVPVPMGGRHAIECMAPAHYLASSYYEKWLHVRTQSLLEAGVLTQEELDQRLAYYRDNPEATLPRREDPEAVQHAIARTQAPESHRVANDVQPAFGIGDAVRARNMHPVGHTRQPRYVRGKRAVVVDYYGVQDFGDTTPTGTRGDPQPLYCVRFEGQELWGESAEANNALYIDMWESYLESP